LPGIFEPLAFEVLDDTEGWGFRDARRRPVSLRKAHFPAEKILNC
jgi:hypothetical protein